KPCIERTLRTHRQVFRLIQMIPAQPQSKKIADWSFYAGSLFSVPVHTQYYFFEMIGLIAGNGHPDMFDNTGTLHFSNNPRFAGLNFVLPVAIVIGTRAVVTGDALRVVIPQLPEWLLSCLGLPHERRRHQ